MRIVMPMRGRSFMIRHQPRISTGSLIITQRPLSFTIIVFADRQPVPRLTNLRARSYSALSLMTKKKFPKVRSTTVLLVRRDGHVAMAGHGQATLDETVMNARAQKVRILYNDNTLSGFAP